MTGGGGACVVAGADDVRVMTGGGGACVVKLNSSSPALSLHQELIYPAAVSLQLIHPLAFLIQRKYRDNDELQTEKMHLYLVQALLSQIKITVIVFVSSVMLEYVN